MAEVAAPSATTARVRRFLYIVGTNGKASRRVQWWCVRSLTEHLRKRHQFDFFTDRHPPERVPAPIFVCGCLFASNTEASTPSAIEEKAENAKKEESSRFLAPVPTAR